MACSPYCERDYSRFIESLISLDPSQFGFNVLNFLLLCFSLLWPSQAPSWQA
ncbi:hypothetical protein Drorol1_Dr00017890, partial [Drosera rotundifolia]